MTHCRDPQDLVSRPVVRRARDRHLAQLVPLMGAFIFVSLIELPVVHLLLPWDTVRLVALVLSVWGLLWMVGLLASLKVFPHLLDDAGLRIRRPTPLELPDGVVEITDVRFYADDARALVAAARERMQHAGAARPVSR